MIVNDVYDPYYDPIFEGIYEMSEENYMAKLYKNGELYENNEFGKITLKPGQLYLISNIARCGEGLLYPMWFLNSCC